MRKVILDFRPIHTREEVHKYLAMKLDLPDYYGENLDALYDCLTEKNADNTVIFVNTALLEEYLGDYAEKILSCFRDASSECGFILREKR